MVKLLLLLEFDKWGAGFCRFFSFVSRRFPLFKYTQIFAEINLRASACIDLRTSAEKLIRLV
ncbi:hypothetical protein EGI32_10120 [Ferruginibacter sp. HRS2-29]|nr:hypothetical protein [Ferruginibacter sp. HRS2-29]